jgi:hypothetical protein
MIRHLSLKIVVALLAAAAVIVGCGGEEGTFSASPSGPVAMITWTPPGTTLDNAAIDPYEEIDHYEIHISADGIFNEEDVPAALVAAVEVLPTEDGKYPAKSLIREFDLNLIPNLPPGNELYVSLRTVGTDRQKSAFMEPVLWTRS